eukprot:10774431-Karenia_brevis.AAC.1
MAMDGDSFEHIDSLLRKSETAITFGENPHRPGTKISNLYEKVKNFNTVGEAKKFASLWEMREWVKGGSMSVVGTSASSEKKGSLSVSGLEEKGREEKRSEDVDVFVASEEGKTATLEKEMLERLAY